MFWTSSHLFFISILHSVTTFFWKQGCNKNKEKPLNENEFVQNLYWYFIFIHCMWICANMHTTLRFFSIHWLINVLFSSSLSSVSPLSSPRERAPPSSHSDRSQEDRQQQEISGEFTSCQQTSSHLIGKIRHWTCITCVCCVCACSWIASYCSGDGVGGFSQRSFGEGGARHTENRVCPTGTCM